MKPSSLVPVCVWGCGPWADNTIRALKTLGVETFLGGDLISDYRQTQTEKLAVRHNITQVDRDNLQDRCRAVVLALPPKPNHELARTFLEKGLDVYIQKPLIPAQAWELFKSAVAQKRVIMGGSDMAYRPDIIQARTLIARGDIGTPNYFRGLFSS